MIQGDISQMGGAGDYSNRFLKHTSNTAPSTFSINKIDKEDGFILLHPAISYIIPSLLPSSLSPHIKGGY